MPNEIRATAETLYGVGCGILKLRVEADESAVMEYDPFATVIFLDDGNLFVERCNVSSKGAHQTLAALNSVRR